MYHQSLTNNFATLNNSIDKANSANGNTNLNAGLSYAISQLDSDTRTGIEKVIIFLTDGDQNDGRVNYDPSIAVGAGKKLYNLHNWIG